MEQNIFEELQLKKQKMITILSKAEEFGWINEREKNDYLSKIENDVLPFKPYPLLFIESDVSTAFSSDHVIISDIILTACLSLLISVPSDKSVFNAF